uniref:Uncharacterized protein n=1 Tax=Anguilla anguilla TaxID=7936 RepID=A0A0E9RTZ6_ANGAN
MHDTRCFKSKVTFLCYPKKTLGIFRPLRSLGD